MPDPGTTDQSTRDEQKRAAAAADSRLVYIEHNGDLRYRTVHEAMGRILAELPAIGKNQRAPQAIGGYAFRGIEDVLLEINPLLSKYGVFIAPEVQSVSHLPDRGKEHVTVVVVRYTFWGPGGDSVVACGSGEGSDTRDKGMQKAMTSAFKYVLFQAFAISTEEGAKSDVDRHVPDESDVPPEPVVLATEAQIVAILERLRPLLGEDDNGQLVYPQEWMDARTTGAGEPGTVGLGVLEAMATGDRAFCSERFVVRMNEVLDGLAPDEGEQLGPCSLCGRTRTQRVMVEGSVRCANATACRKHQQEQADGQESMGAVAATDEARAEASS